VDHDAIRKGVELILGGLGIDPTQDQNFRDTPARVARAYAEIFSGLDDTEKQIGEIVSVTFPSSYSEIIVAKDIVTYSMCPHHLLSVRYVVAVGYLPGEGGSVLGISKLGRLVNVLAHRPVLQEQLTSDITDVLMKLKGCRGAACVVTGEHTCMSMRGAQQREASVTTSSVRGLFRGDASAKSEFMSLIK
jgi:GTP cyclohydrolase IA